MKTLYSAIYTLNRDPFKLFDNITRIKDQEDLTKNDGVLLLHGGEDISPKFYNERPVFTNAPNQLSERDKIEQALFNKAIDLGMPIIGICRGAQLVCCLSGGSLWQHVEGHLGSHDIKTIDGRSLYAAADHHQAMRFEDLQMLKESITLAESNTPTKVFSPDHPDGLTIGALREVVYFKQTNALAIQFHPEWMSPDSPANIWCKEQIETYLFKK